MTMIAQIAQNHNGDVQTAKALIDAACQADCQYVLFEKRTPETGWPAHMLDAPLQSNYGTTGLQWAKGVEFSEEEYTEIDDYCHRNGIQWIAAAWDVASQSFLRRFNLPANVVAAPLIANSPLLAAVAEEEKDTFLFTALASWGNIDTALAFFSGVPYTLMHGAGPGVAPEEAANLRMMEVLRERYSCPVGYEARQQGIFASLLAFVLGAEVLCCPLTLDRTQPGPGHAGALLPEELKELSYQTRRALRIVGDGSRPNVPGGAQVLLPDA